MMNLSERAKSLGGKIWFTKRSDGVDDSRRDEVIVRPMVQEEEDGTWKEVKEFARSHVVECSVFAALIFFALFCIFNAFGFIGPSELKIRSAHYEQFFNNFCQFPQNLQGSEGISQHPNATLISIMAVVRHGQKYGLDNEKCQELEGEENELLEKYQVVERKVQGIVRKTPEIEELEKLAKNKKCRMGTLTSVGKTQQFQVGRFLFQKYKDSQLFNTSNTALIVSLTVSPAERNTASGLALITGLLDQNSTRIQTPVIMKSSISYNGCTDKECDCGKDVMNRIYDLGKNERTGLFRLQSSKHMRKMVEYISTNLTKGRSVKDPNETLEYLLTTDVCFQKPLPCENENCVTWNLMGDMYEYSMSRATKMFDLDMGVERQYRAVNTYPILRYLTLMIERNEKEIQLFSSHDAVVASFLKIFTESGSAPDIQIYATRLVFEVYQSKEKLLRVLHDGNDITLSLKFCTRFTHGLCPAEDLQKFVDKGLFKLAGFKDLNDTCVGPMGPMI